jgi:hypothetical protein
VKYVVCAVVLVTVTTKYGFVVVGDLISIPLKGFMVVFIVAKFHVPPTGTPRTNPDASGTEVVVVVPICTFSGKYIPLANPSGANTDL